MNKYEKLIKEWESIPSKNRSGRLAKEMAATVGMKSMLEVLIAAQLQFLKSKREIKSFAYEPERWQYWHKVSHYTPDFKVVYTDDSVDYYETKGKMTKDVRTKMIAVKKHNPDKSIKMIFERANNKIYKGSETTYGMWCDQKDIPWSEKEILIEWIKK